MNPFKTPPHDLVNRYLAIADMRLYYTPENIKSINPDFTLDMIDDKDQPVVEIDYEYCFFGAETAQVQHLIQTLHTKIGNKKRDEMMEEMAKKLELVKKQDEIYKKILGADGKPLV